MPAPLKNVHDRYTDEEIASHYDAGFWQPTSFTALVAEQVRQRPDATFLLDGTTTFTYGEFAERGLRLAAGLKRGGVERGERIAVQLPNWTEFVVVAAAASRIGAIVVPIMPIYRGDEVGYVLQHSGASVAVTCGEFRGFDHSAMFATLRADAPELRQVYVARAGDLDPALGTSFEGLFADGDLSDLEAELGPDSSPDDGFLIVYTSGTTSRPKGCFHTFNTLRASAAAIANEPRLRPRRRAVRPVAGHPQHRARHQRRPAAARRGEVVPDGGLGPPRGAAQDRRARLHDRGDRDAVPADADGGLRPRQARREQPASVGVRRVADPRLGRREVA